MVTRRRVLSGLVSLPGAIVAARFPGLGGGADPSPAALPDLAQNPLLAEALDGPRIRDMSRFMAALEPRETPFTDWIAVDPGFTPPLYTLIRIDNEMAWVSGDGSFIRWDGREPVASEAPVPALRPWVHYTLPERIV